MPVGVFKALDPENGYSQVSYNPPSVRDFVWNGVVNSASFFVQCLPDAAVGIVPCRASVIEGSKVTHLSFSIEVVAEQDACTYGHLEAEELNTKMEEAKANVAVIDPDELIISDVVLGRGVQVGTEVSSKEAGYTFPFFFSARPVGLALYGGLC